MYRYRFLESSSKCDNFSIFKHSIVIVVIHLLNQKFDCMTLFLKSRKRCRICKKGVDEKGLLFRCLSCGAAFWHRSVLSRNLEDQEILHKTLEEADVPISIPGKNHFFVYLIKLTGKPKTCYVGMTGLHPFYRYLNHIRGYKCNPKVKKRGQTMIRFEGPMSYKDAQYREKTWPEELRKEECEEVLGGH